MSGGFARPAPPAVTFDSIKPVDKRLEEFGISLDSTNAMGLTSLLGQLKGARVEVRAGPTPAAGIIVGIEKRARTQGVEKIEAQELVMVSDGGELRSVPLDQIRGIKLLDAKLREDLEQYLSILQSTIHKNLRKLTISTTGQGERDLFLSYVVARLEDDLSCRARRQIEAVPARLGAGGQRAGRGLERRHALAGFRRAGLVHSGFAAAALQTSPGGRGP